MGIKPFYHTNRGQLFVGLCENILKDNNMRVYEGSVNLIFTSPPFPLNRKKKYGNLTGQEYIEWLSNFALLFRELLAKDGSIVIEIGNAWNQGLPTMSTLPMESLLSFKKAGDFNLCQEFIYYNPARLPSPIQWVNKERIRVKDAFTRLWWLSSNPRPKANNRNILCEYSDRMKTLLKTNKYNSGRRPSQHVVGERSFLQDNGGAIPPNVIIATNTCSNDQYINYCNRNNITLHPARMPMDVVGYFIKFLTDENDLVLDPFAGSNTTGATSEYLNRRWIGIEANKEYARGSLGRFDEKDLCWDGEKDGMYRENDKEFC